MKPFYPFTQSCKGGTRLLLLMAMLLMSLLPATLRAQEVEKTAYAGYSSTDRTLTFYYGTERGDFTANYTMPPSGYQPSWLGELQGSVQSVVFDRSFREYKPESCRRWFDNFSKLTSVNGIENLNTSEATKLSEMFYNCTALTALDLSGLDVSKVTDFSFMFHGCWSLASLKLQDWDTSAAVDMHQMFYNCSALSVLDLSDFNTANVINMERMFDACYSIGTIYASDKFTTANVQSSYAMFNACRELKGAIEYDGSKISADYANYDTGYFTPPCQHVDGEGTPTWSMQEHGATCEKGAYKLYTCTQCSRTRTEYTGEPDPTKHSIVKRDAVASTCNVPGNMEYYECLICGKCFLDAEATQEVTDRSAITLPIDPKLHELVKHDSVEPACDTDGNNLYWLCSVCNNTFLDADATQEIRQKSDVVIRKLGHELNAEGSCKRCSLKVMTLNGVSADLTGIANTAWTILNEGEGDAAVHGLQLAKADNMPLPVTLTSDRDFELTLNVENVVDGYCLENGVISLSQGRNRFEFKAGTHKLTIIINAGDGVRLSDIVATTSFTHEPTPKAVFDTATNTLTFYSSDALPAAADKVYDVPELPSGALGMSWCDRYNVVEKVVFDASFKTVRPKSCATWFVGMMQLREFSGMENLDVSEAVNMRSMFDYCFSLQKLDLSHFNTAKVTDMSFMFRNCSNLTTIYAGDGFTTENVVNDKSMFYSCENLKGAISFDSQKVGKEYANRTDGYFSTMCDHQDENGVSTLTEKYQVPVSCVSPAYTLYHCSKCDKDVKADFVGETDPTLHTFLPWVGATPPDCTHEGSDKVVRCGNCYKLFKRDDADNQTEITFLTEAVLPPLGHEFGENYACSRCGKTDLRYAMLQLDGVTAKIADNNNPWQLADESDPTRGLQTSIANRGVSSSSLKLYLTSDKPFKVSFAYKVSSHLHFDELYILKDDDMALDPISGEEAGRESILFGEGSHTLEFDYRWDTSEGELGDMVALRYILANQNLTEEELEPQPALVYRTSDNSATFMAVGLSTKLASDEMVIGNIDLDNIDSPQQWVEVMPYMSNVRIDESFSQFRPKSTFGWFGGCSNVKEIQGLEHLNTSETVNMAYMFAYCSQLQSLDLSHFDTQNVRSFDGMFGLCTSLKEVDLTPFSTENAISTSEMFYNCYTLENIYVDKNFMADGFDDPEAAYKMYEYCIRLNGAKAYSVYDEPLLASNYRDGYLRTYYKVGDNRFDLYGDMTVDELLLEDGKPFMTHDSFKAHKASLQRAVSDELNTYRIGTICLPYALAPSGDYTLYTVKQVSDTDPDPAQSGTLRKASTANMGTLLLEKVDGTLPAGVPAVFKANGDAVSFKAMDADIVEHPADDETLAKEGWLLGGAFTGYEVSEGYAQSGGDFVSVASLKGDAETLQMGPMTAWLKSIDGSSLSADRLTVASTDGVITSVTAIDALAKGKAQIYDTNGVRLDTFKKGVNIIRHADGTAQKVIVK